MKITKNKLIFQQSLGLCCLQRANVSGFIELRRGKRIAVICPMLSANCGVDEFMTPESLISDTAQLHSLPDILLKANELLDSETSSSDDLAELVGHDPALAAQLLKLVNSAFFQRGEKVDSISKAITLVGTGELRNLIYASKAMEIFSGISSELIDMQTFFHRSLYAAALAKRLAILAGMGRGEPQYLSGLFHDIGKMILFSQQPELGLSILRQSEASGSSLAEVEQQKLGFRSVQIGAALLKLWNLPEAIWQPLMQLHTDFAALRPEAAILQLTVLITNQIEPELKNILPPESDDLPEPILSLLSLSAEQVGIAVVDANLECYEVLSILTPEG